jgi:hypothetical protein
MILATSVALGLACSANEWWTVVRITYTRAYNVTGATLPAQQLCVSLSYLWLDGSCGGTSTVHTCPSQD